MHTIDPAPTAALSHRDVKPHNILLVLQKQQLPAELLMRTTNSNHEQMKKNGAGKGSDTAHLIVPAATASAVVEGRAAPKQQQVLPHAVLMDFGSVQPAEVQIACRTDALTAQEDAEVGYCFFFLILLYL
jgi:serine/threonine protein kinase